MGKHFRDSSMVGQGTVPLVGFPQHSVQISALSAITPSEPVSFGCNSNSVCLLWLIIVYDESRLLFVCLQYYCLNTLINKSKLYLGLNN